MDWETQSKRVAERAWSEIQGDSFGVKKQKSSELSSTNELWVDKYSPKRFTELVSDNKINLDVAKWFKDWEKCVFSSKSSTEFTVRTVITKADLKCRPEKKIILLAGSPGLGKTTLAHVIAKHAGYDVLEVNASDTRSGDALKQKILNVNESRPLFKGQRPQCLILDEIDGIASGPSHEDNNAIQMLFFMARINEHFYQGGAQDTNDEHHAKDANKDNDAEEQEESAKSNTLAIKRKKHKNRPLCRPIICICNNLYAPALRSLRQVALVLTVTKPSLDNILGRLQQICRLEHLRVDTHTLAALYQITDGDLRSCLNTLQFVRAKHGELTTSLLEGLSIGKKDMVKSLFSVWEELFFVQPRTHTRAASSLSSASTENAMDAPKERSALYSANAWETLSSSTHRKLPSKKDDAKENSIHSGSRFNELVSMIDAHHEHDRILQGCFENYPRLNFSDPLWTKRVACGDWLYVFDSLDKRASQEMNFQLQRYLSFPVVAFHYLCCHVKRSFLEFPKDFEMVQKRKNQQLLLDQTVGHFSPSVQVTLSKSAWLHDMLSPLMTILNPKVGATNYQCMGSKDEQVVKHLVAVMVHYHLRYVQEAADEGGQVNYRLDPPVHVLNEYSTIKKTYRELSDGAKQMILQQVEHELLKKLNIDEDEGYSANADGKSEKSNSMDVEKLPAMVPFTIDLNKSKIAVENDKAMKDFFGRTITREQEQRQSLASGKVEAPKLPLWYKYNDGFSNAVRRTLFVKDLF